MAKNLPYFKFFSSEWNDGDITLEDFNLQGLFISICSYYWSREGHITKKHLVKRFRNTELLEELFIGKYLKQRRDKVCIGFLDEQMKEHANRAQSSRENGKLGGRPKHNPEKPSRLLSDNPGEPNKEEDKDKTKSKKKIIEKDKKESETFEIFRKAYLGTKNGFDTEFVNFWKKHKDWKEVLPDLLAILKCQIEQRAALKFDGQFVAPWKNLSTWLNNRCWEEEQAKPEGQAYKDLPFHERSQIYIDKANGKIYDADGSISSSWEYDPDLKQAVMK